MANLSHVVNSLTFGPTIERKMERRLKLIPEEYFRVENTRPMDNRYYSNERLHQAFHHYIKVRLCVCESNVAKPIRCSNCAVLLML
jgi:hypothetical protein